MTIGVLVPTYRRPDDLQRCLEGLQEQERPPDQVVVTVRDTDELTAAFLDDWQPGSLALTIARVSEPGVIAAMNAGLAQITTQIVALTDDDTKPWPDWLGRIEAHFVADPKLGGIGGRDWQPRERGDAAVVGRVQWWGRIIGNHHLGFGPPCDVDLLKGANCAYRTDLLQSIGFDRRLWGEGAQVHWELGLGLAIQRAGYTLRYDPAVALDHFIAARFDDDLMLRGGPFSLQAHINATHNQTLFLWEAFSPLRRAVFLIWSLGVGTRGEPGLLQCCRLRLRGDRVAWQRFQGTVRGRLAGIRTARTGTSTQK